MPHPTRSLRRLALALAAAGLLLATLSVADRAGIGGTAASVADPTFDPLLDAGDAPGCGPVVAPKLQATWLLAAAAKTETAPFQPQPMKAAGGDVPLYRNLGNLRLSHHDEESERAGLFQPGHAALVRLQPRGSAARVPDGAKARPELRRVLLGRGAGSSAPTSTCR